MPTAEQAKELVRQRGESEGKGESEKVQALAQNARQKARATLADKHSARRTELAKAEQELLVRQASEKLVLHAAQERERKRLLFRVRSAVSDLIDRSPALRSVLGHIQKITHLDPKERHVLEREALARRHGREKLDIERRKRGLGRVEARKRQSLEKALQRSAVQARDLEGKAQQQFSMAAGAPVRKECGKFDEGELSISFNDAADFIEGANRAGKDGGDRAPGWKKRTEDLRRTYDQQHGKRRGYKKG